MGAGSWSRGIITAGVCALPALAWAAPPTPGAIQDTLKQPPPLQTPAPAPGIVAPQQAPAESASGRTVTVTAFVLTGNTVFPEATLTALVAGYLGKPLTLGQLYEAADKIAEYYADRGYTLTSVAVPAQSISDGKVRLEVIEGRIGTIGFTGNRRYSARRLAHFITRTRTGGVYLAENLSQDLQNLNTLPGLMARAILKPGADFGTSDVLVKTQEDILDANATLDNYGRHDVGPYRLTASATLNNPTRIGDQFEVLGTHSSTNQLNYWYVDYNLPLDYYGLRLDANYGYAEFSVSPPTPVGGKNKNIDLHFQQSLLRNASNILSATLGYLHTEANADVNGAPISPTVDRVNLLTAGANYSHVWPDSGVTQLIGSLHTNFAKGTPGDPDHERARLELDAQHLQPLPRKLQFLSHIDAVYAADPLPDVEQFAIGGPNSVRAFEPSEVRGDRGYDLQLTLQRPWTIDPVTVVPRIFFDTGHVTDVQRPAGSVEGFDTLDSPGFGADLLYRKIVLKLDWAYPLDAKPTSDGRNDGRVYAALSGSF